jgi:hypothetical protein
MEKRAHEYQVPVSSFTLNEIHQGVLPAGRYRGFDTWNATGTTPTQVLFEAGHAVTGLKMIDRNNAQAALLSGVVITNQGTTIQTSELPVIGIDKNVGNTNPRKDLIIMYYSYELVQGGQVTSIAVIKGDLLGNTPSINNPVTDIILAVVTIAPNGQVFTDMSFEVTAVPNLGNQNVADNNKLDLRYASLTLPNVFSRTQTNYARIPDGDVSVSGGGIIYTGNKGNVFLLTTANYIPVEYTDIMVAPGIPHPIGTKLYIMPNMLPIEYYTYFFTVQSFIGAPPFINGKPLELLKIDTSLWVVTDRTIELAGRVDLLEQSNPAWVYPTLDANWQTGGAYMPLRYKVTKQDFLVIEGHVVYMGSFGGSCHLCSVPISNNATHNIQCIVQNNQTGISKMILQDLGGSGTCNVALEMDQYWSWDLHVIAYIGT